MKKILIAGLIVILGLTGCSSKTDVTPEASVDPSITADPANPDDSNAPDASEYPGFNEEITSAKVTFVVTNVTCGLAVIEDDPVKIKAQGQFCLVRMDVTNNTKKPYTFIGNDQALYDNTSTAYEMDASASVFVRGSNALGYRLEPGESVSTILPYDVPLDAQLAGMLLKADATVEGQLMLFQNR